jgi:peptide/nickel transport system substrate-binding protein
MGTKIKRRALLRQAASLGTGSLLAAVTASRAAAPGSAAAAAPAPHAGTLRYAHYAEPATLDAHWTTAAIVGDITRFMYEGLFALDARSEARPMLMASWTMAPTRQAYTFALRRGVRFHDGREMTADDVVASLRRWGRLAPQGRQIFAHVAGLAGKDRYTVQMDLREPDVLVPVALAEPGQWAVVYPRDVVEAAGDRPIQRWVGTGPYRLVEHIPDQHIKLVRFDGYTPRPEPPDGLAGARVAHFDTVLILPVPDPAVRIAGVQKGEYDFAHSVPPDEYARLRQDPRVVTYVERSASWLLGQFNKREGVMTRKPLRQAVQAALNMQPVMAGAFGPRVLWRLDPGLLPREHYLYTQAGGALYDQHNARRARELLQAAGYRGEPVRWMTSPERPTYYNATQIAAAQLQAVGLNVTQVTVDWATLLSQRTHPQLWDMFTTGMLAPLVDPTLILPLLPGWPGWYQSRDMSALLALLSRQGAPAVRKELWARAQALFYDDAVGIKFGDFFDLHLHRPNLKGITGAPLLDLVNCSIG